jgi:hypothetical protein
MPQKDAPFRRCQTRARADDSKRLGLRKLRFADERRQKGKRGGLRVIYYWWDTGLQFWLFTIYDKDEMSDLTKAQREMFKQMVRKELEARKKNEAIG